MRSPGLDLEAASTWMSLAQPGRQEGAGALAGARPGSRLDLDELGSAWTAGGCRGARRGVVTMPQFVLSVFLFLIVYFPLSVLLA